MMGVDKYWLRALRLCSIGLRSWKGEEQFLASAEFQSLEIICMEEPEAAILRKLIGPPQLREVIYHVMKLQNRGEKVAVVPALKR